MPQAVYFALLAAIGTNGVQLGVDDLSDPWVPMAIPILQCMIPQNLQVAAKLQRHVHDGTDTL